MRLAFPATVGLLVLAHQAMAQNVPTEWHVVIKPDQMAYIGKLLGKQPFDEVAGLVSSLNTQMNAQMSEAQKAAADAEQKKIDEAVAKAKAAKPD
jgi:hypothetical protein